LKAALLSINYLFVKCSVRIHRMLPLVKL